MVDGWRRTLGRGSYISRFQFPSPWIHMTKSLHTTFSSAYIYVDSLAHGRCGCNLKLIIFKLISKMYILSICCEFALWWMPDVSIDDQLTMVEVTAWCRQAASYYIIQCWPSSMTPCGDPRSRWVATMSFVLWFKFQLNLFIGAKLKSRFVDGTPTLDVFDLEKTHMKFWRKKIARKQFLAEVPQNVIRWITWPGGSVVNSRCDWMSGSHFTVQKSKFVFIGSTAIVTERSSGTIFPTYTFFVPNISGLAQTVLRGEAKVVAVVAADAERTENINLINQQWFT